MEQLSLNAARKYVAARSATEPGDGAGPRATVADFARNFAETLEEGERQAMTAMTGDADPHSLVQALAQAELAVETVVTVRDKVVEAYQEILRMPV